jgi:protein-L-isoaspartate(D-aspartate) O-methyltransferase
MANLNSNEARFNMIEQQIRTWEVLDQNVLDLLARLPRDEFVPAPYRGLAYADICIPLHHGEHMLAPKLEARLLQTVAAMAHETALEIGTGSGYFTALLASQTRHVYSVDIHADFLSEARAKLNTRQLYNVTLEHGDAARGWDRHRPYDVVVVSGSLPILPDSLKNILTIGGRLCVIVGDSPVMQVRLITRIRQNEWRTENLFETDVPVLKNALQPNRFVL